MFNSITWEIFASAVILLVAGYYGITILLLYHREIVGWFQSHRESTSFKSPETSNDKLMHSSVMGNTLKEDVANFRSSVVSSDEVVISDDEEKLETIQSTTSINQDHLLIGSVADLLQEIKSLIQLITESNSDKTECVSLFRTLLLRYPHLQHTYYRDTINLYITEVGKSRFSFELSLKEVNTWWTEDNSKK